MATRIDPMGSLDLSRVSAKEYSDLTSTLTAAPPGTHRGSKAPAALFQQTPAYSDLSALAAARPVDPYLYAALESLLGGVSSGPALLCSLFRVIDEHQVVVRLFFPIRPPADDEAERPARPLYFRLKRSQAVAAEHNKWVGAGAAEWIALLAAVYYTYIGDRKAYYGRTELGGGDNAAWLLLFGKDSSRAPPRQSTDDKQKEPTITSTATGDRTEVFHKLLGVPDGMVDLDFCASQIFDEDRSQRPLSKQWQKWVTQIKIHPQTKLRGSLTIDAACKHKEFRKWLHKERKGLPTEIISRLLIMLEGNGLLVGEKAQRYSNQRLLLWKRISKALSQKSVVAIEPKQDAADFLGLVRGSPALVEIVGLKVLPLPSVQKSEERALRYVILRAPKGSKEGNRKFVWEQRDGVQVLSEQPNPKPQHWLELDAVFRQGVRVIGGPSAKAALAQAAEKTDKDFEISLIDSKP